MPDGFIALNKKATVCYATSHINQTKAPPTRIRTPLDPSHTHDDDVAGSFHGKIKNFPGIGDYETRSVDVVYLYYIIRSIIRFVENDFKSG